MASPTPAQRATVAMRPDPAKRCQGCGAELATTHGNAKWCDLCRDLSDLVARAHWQKRNRKYLNDYQHDYYAAHSTVITTQQKRRRMAKVMSK